MQTFSSRSVVAGHGKRLVVAVSTTPAQHSRAGGGGADVLVHTTATLLLKARVPLAVVQRILGRSSPTITARVYGHLDVEDLRGPGAAPVPAGGGTRFPGAFAGRGRSAWCGVRRLEVKGNGPSWIRTRDQSVMSRQLLPLS